MGGFSFFPNSYPFICRINRNSNFQKSALHPRIVTLSRKSIDIHRELLLYRNPLFSVGIHNCKQVIEVFTVRGLVLFYIASNQISIMATTITIKDETKKVLATLKGNKDWDSFLKELAFGSESEALARRRAFIRTRLQELFVEETRVKGWAREY